MSTTTEPTPHVVTLVADPDRFNRYRPTCTCGWQAPKAEAICRATAAGDRHERTKGSTSSKPAVRPK